MHLHKITLPWFFDSWHVDIEELLTENKFLWKTLVDFYFFSPVFSISTYCSKAGDGARQKQPSAFHRISDRNLCFESFPIKIQRVVQYIWEHRWDDVTTDLFMNFARDGSRFVSNRCSQSVCLVIWFAAARMDKCLADELQCAYLTWYAKYLLSILSQRFPHWFWSPKHNDH